MPPVEGVLLPPTVSNRCCHKKHTSQREELERKELVVDQRRNLGAADRRLTVNDQSFAHQRLPSSVSQGRGQFQGVVPWRRRLTWTQQDVVVEREDGTGSDVLRSARWWEPCCGCRWLSSLVTPLQSLRPPDALTGRLATVVLETSLGESDTRSSRAALSPRFSSAGWPGLLPPPPLD